MSIESISKISSLGVDPMFSSVQDLTGAIQQDSFSSLLINKVSAVDSQIHTANGLVEQYIKGDNVAVHDVLIAMGKAKTELQLVIEIRNKLLESYQEVTKIQL